MRIFILILINIKLRLIKSHQVSQIVKLKNPFKGMVLRDFFPRLFMYLLCILGPDLELHDFDFFSYVRSFSFFDDFPCKLQRDWKFKQEPTVLLLYENASWLCIAHTGCRGNHKKIKKITSRMRKFLKIVSFSKSGPIFCRVDVWKKRG